MKTLSAPSYTRITLALDIIRTLESGPFAGYHELGIIKHQIDLCDTISIESASAISIECDHQDVPIDHTNICWQAAALLQQEFGIAENVTITIKKNIPVMGGLAGGSTNAATVLMLLNQWWALGLSPEKLRSLGRKLGMDVPFYFNGRTAFDSESTGLFRPIETDLILDIVLVVPPFGVSTKSAYQQIDYRRTAQHVAQTGSMESALVANDRSEVLSAIHNDFELSVFEQYPTLKTIQSAMLLAGCERAFMSGSGSTMVGIASDAAHGAQIAELLRPEYTVITSRTL